MGDAWHTPFRAASLASTPSTTAASRRASLRPPIFNPYDRFTQNEFDSWIGDITGQLKRALGREPEPEPEPAPRHGSNWQTVPGDVDDAGAAEQRDPSPASTDAHEDESVFEDSFAHIASRKAKGKARDPREGPGFGVRDQPIELLSDSEEEEVAENLEGDPGNSTPSDDTASEDSSEEEAYSDYDLSEEEDPAHPAASTSQAVMVLSDEVSGEDEEVDGYSGAENDGVLEEDEEGEEDELQLPPNGEVARDEDIDEDEGFYGTEEKEEDGFSVPIDIVTPIDVELRDPWDGPRKFAEDFYSGGDRLAPGLTPNHLTPLERSPAPALVTDVLSPSAVGPEEDTLSITPGVLSEAATPQLRNVLDADEVEELPRSSISPAGSDDGQPDNDELTTQSYDVTTRLADEADREWDSNDGDTSAVRTGANGHRNADPPPQHQSGAKVKSSRQDHDAIWVLPSDDSQADADGDEDERFLGAAPLGTSDLDIRDHWGNADEDEDGSEASEEDDEIQEIVPTQALDDVADVTLRVDSFSEAAGADDLSDPRVAFTDPLTDISAYQFVESDSFGDLPVSSPPSADGSPKPEGSISAPVLEQQPSMEEFFAQLEKEVLEEEAQASTSSAAVPEVEATKAWVSQALENILSGNLSGPEDVPDEVLEEAATQYLVEETSEVDVLSLDDGLDDARSIPAMDVVESLSIIQTYEVEELSTDGRRTEEPDISPEAVMEEDVATAVAPEVVVRPPTPEPPVVSAASESVASHETLPKEQSDSKISSAEAHVTALISEDMPVPAPITADPTVPDPVPGDSTPASPASPVSLDFSTTSKLSAVPPALLRALELEGSRSDSSTSGLFTPAQRSEDSTPVPSEDGAAVPSEGAAEASAVLEDGEVQDEPAAPMSPQAEEGPPSVEHSTLVNEEGSTADERNSASHDDLPDLVLPDGADDDADEIGAAADDDDDIASTPRGGSVEPTVSESPIEEVKDITLPVEAAAEALPKEPGQPVDIPVTVDEEHAHSIVEGDEDADGEVDPDYSPAESAESVDKEDPFQFMGSKSKVAPGEVGNNEPESAEVSPDPEVSPATPTVDAAPREEEPEAAEREPEVVPNNATPAAQDEPAPAEEAVPDKKEPESPVEAETKADDEEEAPTRNLKRKWRDPNPAPARVTRSQSGVVAKGPGKKGKTSSRKKAPASKKGKPDSSAPAGDGDGDSIDDGASESASVSSGASTVYRLLASASRAGSVASTVSGDSPSTFASPIASRSRPIPSLIHSHGFLHHHHGAPPPPPPPLVIPSTSNGQQSAPKSARTEAHSPVTTSEPSTPSLKRAPNVNSPVTRSNCRFHKISLPREEDGPRVFFIVPGCSLGDGELMEEEEIKDEGFSTNEDHMRMISNVEALELNPYLIGVVRQLVGVDLLREQQEIFYLPTEGEKVRRRRRKGAGAIESLRQLHRQSISSARPVLAREGSPRPSEASRGDAGSVRGENGAHTDNEGSALSNLNGDGEDDRSERPAKRRKRSADAEEGTSPAAASADGTQDASARPGSAAPEEKQPTASSLPPVVRRSKRKALNPDAAAYKPGQDDAEEEEEEVETRTRRGTRKGTKRSRTMEETLQSAPKAKRTRLRKTASAVAAAGAADS